MTSARRAHGNALSEGFRLHWYRIGHVLGQGGFGITYLATDTNLDKPVAIKEYLPIELAVREDGVSVHPFTEDRKQSYLWGLERFLSEARTLARFSHPNIVRVHAVFEANNTAYMVMEYEQGECLEDLIKFGRVTDETQLLRIVHPLLDGLEHMHEAGFIHRDVKPDNIYIRGDGSPVLLDFGSARLALGGQTRTLTSVVSPGFSPYEQYHPDEAKQGPWTDIYGLGATLYAAMNRGHGPPDALVRANARIENTPEPLQPAAVVGRGRFGEAFLTAIDAALEFAPEKRPQSVGAWRDMLPPAPAGEELADAATRVNPPADSPRSPPAATRRSRAVPVMVAILVLLVLAAGGAWYAQLQRDRVQGRRAGAERQAQTDRSVERQRRQADAEAKAAAEAGTRAAEEAEARAAAEAKARAAEEAEKRAAAQAKARAAEEARARAVEEAQAQAAAEAEARAAAAAKKRETVERLLEQGARSVEALRLSTPAGNNALEAYRAVLALDAENAEARAGIERIVVRYLELADAEIAAGRFDRARQYLDIADSIHPQSEATRRARDRLAAREAAVAREPAKGEAARAASVPPVPRPGSSSGAAADAVIRDTLRDGSPGPVMVRIAAGRFGMGSPPAEAGRSDDEGPQRSVTIGSDFALGRFPVTVGEYRRFVEATGFVTRAEANGWCVAGASKRNGATWRDPGFKAAPGDQHPVVCVAWRDAEAYAEWLGAQTGAIYRLPSEAEWEYAARGGTESARFWGDDPAAACGHANVGDMGRAGRGGMISGSPHPCTDGFPALAPVGRFQANAFGLHDMLGNVWEWTADCWKDRPADGPAKSGKGCPQHARRGGSFASGIEEARSAVRRKGRPPGVALGFRVARDL